MQWLSPQVSAARWQALRTIWRQTLVPYLGTPLLILVIALLTTFFALGLPISGVERNALARPPCEGVLISAIQPAV
jgi:hypothetical protein